jgi:voltage-gated potassium channel
VEGFGWIDAFYFSATTLTTVGYGDLSPQTDFGKIFTTVYIFVGIGIIFGFINAVQEHQKKHILNYYYDDYEN